MKEAVPRMARLLAQGLVHCLAPKPRWLFPLPGLSASLALHRREGLSSLQKEPS